MHKFLDFVKGFVYYVSSISAQERLNFKEEYR